MQQAAQAKEQQPQPDPTQALIEAEKIKAQTKMQTDQVKHQLDGQKAQAQHMREMAKLQAEQQFKRSDAMRQDDLARDQMIQDLYVKLADIEAKVTGQVEAAQINAAVQREQARNNPKAPNNG
jgi:multidrug resistance efflux pump